MDQKLQISFIPKQPMMLPQRRSGIGLLFLLSLIVFLISLLLSGGAFAYQRYFLTQVSSESSQLAAAEQQFQPQTIESLERLDQRINAGKALLAQHIVDYPVFNALGAATLSSVSFSSFQMSQSSTGDFSISLDGQAANYQALALQSDAFLASGVFVAPAFSDVNLGPTGQVTFSLSATLPMSALLMSSVLSSGTSASSTPVVSTISASATSSTP